MTQSQPPAPAPVPPPVPPQYGAPAAAPAYGYPGQAAVPQVRFAGFWARAIAYIVDGFIAGILVFLLSIVFLPLMAIFGGNENNGLAGLSALLYVLLAAAVSVLYFPFFWQRSGQTPGARIMRFRVVDYSNGQKIGWGKAIIRLIGLWIAFAVFYIGVIWVAFQSEKRGWQDLIAGTCVIEV